MFKFVLINVNKSNKMQEQFWKVIPDTRDRYMVSNTGQIKSLIGKEKLLRPFFGNGYHRVDIIYTWGRRSTYIHRLVANAFIDNPLNKREVNHIDGNKLNNNDTNLEWATKEENRIHAIKFLPHRMNNQKVARTHIDGTNLIVMNSISDGLRSVCSASIPRSEFNKLKYHLKKCLNGITNEFKGYKWRKVQKSR
jgi:hypothetical protein